MRVGGGTEEAWRAQYWARPYLEHVPDAELYQRGHDIFSNLAATLDSVRSGEDPPEATRWLSLWTHFLEESDRRFGILPAGFPPKFWDGYAQPPCSARITHLALAARKRLPPSGTYFVKYGEAGYLRSALETGRIQVSPASSYSHSSNPALRDKELELDFNFLPSELKMEVLDRRTRQSKGLITPIDNVIQQRMKRDYYVYCFSESYSPLLFAHFGYAACLVIHQHEQFVERIITALEAQLPGWVGALTPVSYIDPFNAKITEVDIYSSKHFRYAYEREWRIVWLTAKPVQTLSPKLVEIGPLTDLCELIDLA